MVDFCVCLDGMKPNIYNQDTELEIWKVLWPYLFWAETYPPKPDSVLIHPRNQCVIVYGDILKNSIMLKWGSARP